MLLEIGLTLRRGVADYKLARDALSLDTPDGKTLPLHSATEQQARSTLMGRKYREWTPQDH